MNSLRRTVAGVGILSVVLATLALGPALSGAAAAGGFCGVTYSGTTITWTGKSPTNSHNWDDPDNWSPKTVPDAAGTPGTYQDQYVCIGDNSGGGAATVEIHAGKFHHIAGLDVGNGAEVTVDATARLFLGAVSPSDTVPSYVRSHSELHLVSAVLGGNSPLNVSGTLGWSGSLVKGHRTPATQTSSECVYDSTIPSCDLPSGGGLTTIDAGGQMLVDGSSFGGVDLGDQRVIDNSGAIKLTNNGVIAMDDGTELVNAKGSSLTFDGPGGIYQGAAVHALAPAKIVEKGSIVKDSNDISIVATDVKFARKPRVTVAKGELYLQGAVAPSAKLARGQAYGVGTCSIVPNAICHQVNVTAANPEAVKLRASSESTAPKHSTVSVNLVSAPRKIGGKRVLGQAVNVTAPTKKTTHATTLIFIYDKTTKGLKSSTKPSVYRGGGSHPHKVSTCSSQPITAHNDACVETAVVAKSGKSTTKGDLTITLKTIAPNSRWLAVV